MRDVPDTGHVRVKVKEVRALFLYSPVVNSCRSPDAMALTGDNPAWTVVTLTANLRVLGMLVPDPHQPPRHIRRIDV